MLEKLDVNNWLELNAKLQSKKNDLRKALKEKGILKKEGNNKFDKYAYFTEAQYKELFTELFSENNLELKFDELDYCTFEGTEKQANGRMPKLIFRLFDIETGFYEDTHITGEGIDKGDKAGYKAYTGALKYYLANTFMVATGDDPETESISAKMNVKNMTLEEAKNYVLNFGKHKGKKLTEVDEGYLAWLYNSDKTDEVVKKAICLLNQDKTNDELTPYDFMSDEDKLKAQPIDNARAQQLKTNLTKEEIIEELKKRKKTKVSELTLGEALEILETKDKAIEKEIKEKEEVF